MAMVSSRLSPAMQVVTTAVRKAGRRLLRDFGEVEQLQVSMKGPSDFVSTADLRAEQTLKEELSKARPGFAFHRDEQNPFGKKALGGRSARIVVTMGMPALLYRWYFRAHSVKSLERNILGFVGIAPVHETLIGLVDRLGEPGVAQWCAKLKKLGRQAA